MKTEIFSNIFGTLTGVQYLVGFVFVIVAIILRWTFTTHKAVKKNPNTPKKFSLKYWWENNWLRKLKTFIQVVIITFLVFRFTPDIIGQTFSYVVAVSIGLAFDAYKKKFIEWSKEIRKKLLG